MTMSRTKNLITLLDACEKTEFDLVVKAYLKHEFNYDKIVFTDKKDDKGLDVRVFDFNAKKIQYQITTQKSKSKQEKLSFDIKIKADLEKAKDNFKNYNFSNKLIFFYSKELSVKIIREYEKLAFTDYEIDLDIIEANRIAEEAENIIEIQTILYKLNDLDTYQIKVSEFDNRQENLIFDLVTFGKPSEFKIQIIESFILQSLFLNSDLSKDGIINLCIEKFSVKENGVFYDKLINKLLTTRKITRVSGSNEYSLTTEESDRLKRKNNQFEIDEKLFINEISNILTPFDQVVYLNDYIIELKKLYVENFDSDLNDLLEDSDSSKLYGIIKKFTSFIESKIADKKQGASLAIALLRFCLNNKFIQKIAASKVYCEKINYNRLQNYLNTKKKIFIDTSIALYGLCYYYKPNTTFDNYFYRNSKSLIDFSSKENIKLNIFERYVWEIQNHIKESFNILPFTNIPKFRKLGTSRNVFYNFYNYLHTNNEIDYDLTFKAFLSTFGFEESTSTKSFNSKIQSYLSEINMEKQSLTKDYDIEETSIMFIRELSKNNKFKTKFSRNNDSIMVEFLADSDVEVHPLQPLFVTWDKTFFDVQRLHQKQFPSSQNWMMLSPGKLIDAYAILKFSINSETVTENLLALISDDIISNTHSLLDTITYILNPSDEIGLEYTNRLAEIRDQEINQLNNKEIIPPENYEGEAVIDDVFYHLTSYYQEEDRKLELFKEIFTRKEFIEDVITVLTNTVNEFYETKKVSDSLFTEFDKFILVLENEKKMSAEGSDVQ